MKFENLTYQAQNCSEKPECEEMGWPTETGTYAAIFLTIFLLFSLLPNYRYLAPINLVAIIGIGISSIHVISYFVGVISYPNYNNMKNLGKIYLFESASPQLGYAVSSRSLFCTRIL